MIGAGVLTDDEDRVAVLEVAEPDGALSDADSSPRPVPLDS
jgi:hypothetical protein